MKRMKREGIFFPPPSSTSPFSPLSFVSGIWMVKHHGSTSLLENICHCCPLAEISAEQHKKSRFLLSSSLLW
jgi:hypothetical protein